MNYAVLVHRDRRLDELPEKVARERLFEGATVGDVVEEIDGWEGTLHDEDEAVRTLEVLEKTYDAWHVVDFLHQCDLHWDSNAVLRLSAVDRTVLNTKFEL